MLYKIIRSAFPVTGQCLYLDTAYVGPPPRPVTEASAIFQKRLSHGSAGRIEDWLEEMMKVRALAARLIGAAPEEVALTPNTTTGTALVAGTARLGPGDSIVLDDLDFSSNTLVWLSRARKTGAETRIAASADGQIPLTAYERLVDSRTRVLSTSLVSHANGHVADVRRLSSLAHAYGALLHVDASQAVGALKVDVKAMGIDTMAFGAYKWLLGPMGLAFFYARRELVRELEPLFPGWMHVRAWSGDANAPAVSVYEDARKFETASLPFGAVLELRAALEFLESIGMEEIESRVLSLSSRLRTGLLQLGVEIKTPPSSRSGITTFSVPDSSELAAMLARNKVVVSMGRDRIRVSPHFFNSEDEVDTFVSLIGAWLCGLASGTRHKDSLPEQT